MFEYFLFGVSVSYRNCNTVFTETSNFSVALLKDMLGERNLIKRGLMGYGLEDRRPGIGIPKGIFLFSAATDRTWGPLKLLFSCSRGSFLQG
jgi:hypothetical protein